MNWVDFWKTTRWHCTRFVWEEWIKVIDSFKWRKYNEYKIENIRWLVDNWVFYRSAYVILPQENIQQKKEDLKRLKDMEILVDSNIENNKKMRHLTTSESFKEWLSEANNVYRSKREDIQQELQKL